MQIYGGGGGGLWGNLKFLLIFGIREFRDIIESTSNIIEFGFY